MPWCSILNGDDKLIILLGIDDSLKRVAVQAIRGVSLMLYPDETAGLCQLPLSP